MATFVVAHGAWSAGWAWKNMHPLMAARGHRLITPTFTGLGEHGHLARPGIDLDTHIADILGVLAFEDLSNVSLIGHSYGGMVATAVADRALVRIARLIYIDAFAPADGDSVFELLPASARAQRKPSPDGMIPPVPMPPDTSPEDRAWCDPLRLPQPAKTFEQKLKLQNGALTLPRHYIYCTRNAPDDRFRQYRTLAAGAGAKAAPLAPGQSGMGRARLAFRESVISAPMSNIAIVVGNPMRDSYCEALGKSYLRGAESGGHTAKLFLLSDMTFGAVLREGYRREQPLEPDLVAARQALRGSDHLVFVFPLWCGDMPAIVKGFIERVLQSDLLAIQASRGKANWKLFKGKSARVIMTMGMPGWFYRWYHGAHALKLLKRNILHLVGVSPVRSSVYGLIQAAGDEKRKQWLREVEALGRLGQ